MSDPILARIDELISAVLPGLIEIRHDLHAHPQGGFEETYAGEVVQRELEATELDAILPFILDKAFKGEL